ncbi:DUF1643 domain-containing protein [Bacillus sp. ISL-75]|uniref:DUF1643 domain-containing protein n=1 Tax=Bacillus sp. ISL-75 TaxID=2819137 RepID=UPI001BEC7FAE|nr:DUF1643 domain-containing protein [Bacillus sp. ISL-75]MBT2729507.1 DUF1643 domain-containing protein [Bacillus sp. ISL-75]
MTEKLSESISSKKEGFFYRKFELCNNTNGGRWEMTLYRWKKNEIVNVIMDSEKKNRYLLNCSWDPLKPCVTFIMINPSEGNEEIADRTLRRCVNFSSTWGFGSMSVVNLFSQITSDPDQLLEPLPEEISENNKYINLAISEAKFVIFGWGELEKDFISRVKEVKNFVPLEKQFCIKKTADGRYPRHPLFLSAELTPIPWIGD